MIRTPTLQNVGNPVNLLRALNAKRALQQAILGGYTPAKPPTMFSSRQRNSYCSCGKRGEDGRQLKFKDCCGKGR